MPTYRDILQRSTLQIFSGGRCIGDIDPKGSVGGGLDPHFSPLKTRRARKLKGVKIEQAKTTPQPVTVTRALRARKALARGKK